MKKLSSRMIAAITNGVLMLIVLVIGIVCFLPSASVASGLKDRVYYKGSSKDGVSLMINVYWGTEIVKSMLDVLDGYDAKVTFFLGGCWADDNTDLVKEIVTRGHEIGSHGYFHRDHDKLGLEENISEIKNSVQFLEMASGTKLTLFAPPSGAYNDNVVTAAESLGLKTILWSKDTIDWRDKDSSLTLRRATKDVEGGDLILMHPMEHTLKALPQILTYYAEHSLKVIPVSSNIV